MGIGTAIRYKPSDYVTINYSNYFGNENPQPIRLNRFFNNFYTMVKRDQWESVIGADYRIQQTLAAGYDTWFGLIASLKRSLGDKFAISGRAEYYSDPNAVILNEGWKVSGFSANIDFKITKASLMRFEARKFTSPDAIFRIPDPGFSRQNFALTGSLSVWY